MAATTRQEKATAKQRRALHLRIVGQLSYAAVAASLLPCPAHQPSGSAGCSLCVRLYANASSARKACQAALDRDFPPVSQEARARYVQEQQATIAVVLGRMVRDALDATLDPVDRARAAGQVESLLRRQATLLGLDARVRSEAEDDLDAQVEVLLAELGVHP